jgi:hypothetical protein
MPIQTSNPFTAGQPVPEPTPTPAPVEAEVAVVSASVCGHINKHYTGADEMACVLTKGHLGNHEAPYVNRGMVEIGAWKDEAGTPVNKHGDN